MKKVETEVFVSGATRESKAGKGRYDLLSPLALERAAMVMEAGEVTHGQRNWEKGLPMTRTLDSALRHIMKYLAGEVIDRDSGLPTLSHALVNLMFCNHFEEGVTRGIYDVNAIMAGMPGYNPTYDIREALK